MITRKLKVMFAVALFAGAAASHAAGSTGASVAVNATLNPGCSAGVTGTGAFSYAGTSNAAITAVAHQSVTFTCTRGLTLTGVAWDTTLGSNTTTGTTAPSATTNGTVAGLEYTLDTGSATVGAGTAASGTTGATAATYVYNITRTLAANQPGDASATASITRTLTLSY
jgi:hypothetical protein